MRRETSLVGHRVRRPPSWGTATLSFSHPPPPPLPTTLRLPPLPPPPQIIAFAALALAGSAAAATNDATLHAGKVTVLEELPKVRRLFKPPFPCHPPTPPHPPPHPTTHHHPSATRPHPHTPHPHAQTGAIKDEAWKLTEAVSTVNMDGAAAEGPANGATAGEAKGEDLARLGELIRCGIYVQQLRSGNVPPGLCDPDTLPKVRRCIDIGVRFGAISQVEGKALNLKLTAACRPPRP